MRKKDLDKSKVIKMLQKSDKDVGSSEVQIGILTVSPPYAQSIADIMVEAGIRAIWNFTPITLNVPDYVILQREELASSLAVLSHRLLVDKEQ